MRMFELIILMAVLVGCDVRNEPEKFTEVLPVVQATTDPVEPHEQLRAYRKALRATSTQLLCSRYVEFQAWHDSSLIELSDETLLQTVYLDIGDLEIGEWEEGKSLKTYTPHALKNSRRSPTTATERSLKK